ncbi:MAG: Gfo/Idh/MocA family oxidoreductase [Clostridia bacterium]|nr:Gfo/Idh/MocA family oxidoreductase [Clostridia bacterium]
MKKIVMLGCENSHVNTFLSIMQDAPDKYRDIEVIGVYSEDTEAMQKVCDAFGVPAMRSYDEAVGIADGIVVTARHGGKHYPYAKPYIASGVPMFIDKPITVDEQEAIDFMRECREAGVRLTGGSCCKYAKEIADFKTQIAQGDIRGGLVRAPINMDNPYGGFFFYSQHLVEMLGELFGLYPCAVRAYRAHNTVNVVFRYENYDVIGLYTEFSYHYFVSVASDQRTLASDATIGTDCFVREFDEFCVLLRGGAQKVSYGDFIAPVFVLNAINRSLASGREESVRAFEV